MTQNEKIIDYMKRFGSISTLQAFSDLGCTRLPSRIHELRKHHEIEDDWVTAKNRFGETVSFKRYYLKKEE